MKKASFILLILSCSLFPLSADTSMLGLKELLSLVLDKNPDIRQAGDIVAHSTFSLEAAAAGRYPELGLKTDYGFGYQTKKQDEYFEYEDYVTHAIDMGLYMKQLLPSFGTIELSFSDTLILATIGKFEGAQVDPRFDQAPSISLTLLQPVFCNGMFIDGRIYDSALRKQELIKQKAIESERAVKNKTIAAILELVFEVQNLRNVIKQQEKAIEIRNQSLSRLEKSLESGIVAETDVAEMRVEIGKEKELLLQAIYELAIKEDSLRTALGLEQSQAINFSGSLVDTRRLKLPPSPGVDDLLLAKNPNIKMKELDLAGKRLDTILGGLERTGYLTSKFSISPRYPYYRTISWDHNFASSISDFFDPLAGIDISFTVEMNVPFFDAGRHEYRKSADEANEKMSEEAFSVIKKELEMQLESLAVREKNLGERVRLLQDNLKLLERQRDINWKLLKIGQITELDLTNIEVEYLKKENELNKAGMDGFLAALEKLSLLGRDLDEELKQWEK